MLSVYCDLQIRLQLFTQERHIVHHHSVLLPACLNPKGDISLFLGPVIYNLCLKVLWRWPLGSRSAQREETQQSLCLLEPFPPTSSLSMWEADNLKRGSRQEWEGKTGVEHSKRPETFNLLQKVTIRLDVSKRPVKKIRKKYSNLKGYFSPNVSQLSLNSHSILRKSRTENQEEACGVLYTGKITQSHALCRLIPHTVIAVALWLVITALGQA